MQRLVIFNIIITIIILAVMAITELNWFFAVIFSVLALFDIYMYFLEKNKLLD